MNSEFPALKSFLLVGWGGLFDYSVKPGPSIVLVKARFGQVGD